MGVNIGITSSWALKTNDGRSIYSSPLVQDGLVLNFNAGKLFSYPGSGTIITDLDGNSNGTIVGNPIFSSTNGGQFIFDGTAKYITASLPPGITNTGTSTLQFWANISSPSQGPIFGFESGAGNAWCVGMSDGAFSSATFENSGNRLVLLSGFSFVQTLAIINSSGWVMITLTKNDTAYGFYLNGTFSTNFTTSRGSIPVGVLINRIVNSGTYHGNNPVAHALIYNKVLSGAEVLQNFNATKSRFGL